MRIILLSLFLLTALPNLAASQIWHPTPGHTEQPLWPSTPPNARPSPAPETVKTTGPESLVAGRPWTYINSVSIPTLTVYPPAHNTTGAAVLVFPGGGYQILAIDLEGTEVCDWLTSRGITCVLVKYRVPGEAKLPRSGPYPESPEALEDAQRAISLVRFQAGSLHLNPHRIGVLGFSAGGHLVAATSVHFTQRLYPTVDDADRTSSRPDFAIALYPGHLSLAANSIALNPDIRTHITPQTPPTFLLQNEDDNVDRVEDALSYFAALKRAGIPAELHVYPHGGHAFGLRPTALPATHWPNLVETWLTTLGILPP